MTDVIDPFRFKYWRGSNQQWDWQSVMADGVGVQQAATNRSRPRWNVNLSTVCNSTSELALQTIFATCKGPAVKVYIYTPDFLAYWPAATIGTGNGALLAFAIPSCEVSLGTETVTNTTAKTRGTDYEIGVENRLLTSEAFSNATNWAVVSGATVARGSGHAGPTGNLAWHIETSGGAAVGKMRQTLSTTTVGNTVFAEVQIKNNSAKAVTIKLADGASSDTETITNDSAWHTVRLSITYASGNVYLDFSAPAIADALDFLVWHPWIAYTSTVRGTPSATWAYIPTGAAAIVADSYARQYCVFYTAPASAAITISWQGRRLLLARLLSDAPVPRPPYYTTHTMSLTGEEA
jgi:hypothetical protein